MNIAIVGGGAAGFFSAINLATLLPDAQIEIFEKTSKVLSKVKVSGGGRCNVTNACFAPNLLAQNYPRGAKELKKLFQRFQPKDTVNWFEKRGVPIKKEVDNRMFPASNNSQSIIDCFLNEAQKRQVNINKQSTLTSLKQTNNGKWIVTINDNIKKEFDHVIVTTGGAMGMWNLLQLLGIPIVKPVPSLFTFHIQDTRLDGLPGIGFKNVRCKFQGSSLNTEGALLITHWGLSGPAILKLSAFGAREFHDLNYQFTLSVNFCPAMSQDEVKATITNYKNEHAKRQLATNCPVELPKRYWNQLTMFLEINNKVWGELSKKDINKLCEDLCNASFQVTKKSTFKEEFVTAGGVDLKFVNLKNMESTQHQGLHFAGEVLNIDGVTGGFNFQAAWTTSWICATEIASLYNDD